MKKKLGIAIGTLAGAAVIGLGVFQSSAAQADPKLSTDDIRQMVTDQYEGTITEMELDKEFNKVVYEVEIEDEKQEIDLKLDGDTGEVIKENKKERKNDGMKITEKEKKQKLNNSDILSTDEVTKIALNEFSGTVTDLELDEDDDRLIYEIEIKNGDDEADFEIDAVSGEILELEIDTDDDKDKDDDDDDDRYDD
ncbi:hypothetical protein CIL03_09190 [Virgibacillus indicus]|uniref:PepSY domain-containing protein n=1 Tax=Virgibacillus indicus TaxID=2024554 RepID=A0A265NBH9_9BACI|nr:PepSY domain-containing protein [Virgibacillus indicus]OZU89171.1 hypothetical protein CIL03_09190 [Virgibacillus indicus]